MTVQSNETCLSTSREGFLEEVQCELNLRRGVVGFWTMRTKRSTSESGTVMSKDLEMGKTRGII